MTKPWKMKDREMDVSRSLLMGILNVTPDSFFDGGHHDSLSAACKRAEAMVAEGADLIDIGGESTRPGSEGISEPEERRRVVPLIRELSSLGVPLSIDTSKSGVAEAALEAGAVVVNDVTGLTDPDMRKVVRDTGAGVVIMHMQGAPRSMQTKPSYDDVVLEVAEFLKKRRSEAEELGIGRECIVLDPGIGFGKRLEHNLALMTRVRELVELGSPILIGASRKSFLRDLAGIDDAKDRLPGSLAAAVMTRMGGASIFRVHDVAATKQALAVADAGLNSQI